jgi:3D (Asp-Asp-Asp) domain-containing protein
MGSKGLLAACAALTLALAAPMAQAGTYQYVPGAIGTHVLQLGDRGPAVAVLQGDLSQFGDYQGPIDGLFGPATQAALKAFQNAQGIPATGLLDQATFEALLQVGGWSGTWTAGATATQGGEGSAPGGQAGSGTSGGPMLCGLPSTGQTLDLTATAYGPSLQDNYPYGPVNYFGQPLQPGDVAVDPNVIPLGTHLYITGYNDPNLPQGGMCGIANDEGGAIKGDRIDIFMDANPLQVSNFGIQQVQVTILK